MLIALLPVYISFAATVPWTYLRLTGFQGSPVIEAALSGLAILGAAFLLSWAAELAQLEISAALAVAVLSLIAVLPEYSVDIYFAWQAGKDPIYSHYAVANMTGANRLLIGIGWSSIILLFWWKTKQKILHLEKKDGLELGALTFATIYAFTIPLKGTLSLIDTVVLILLFIIYIRATSRQEVEDPHLIGPALALSKLPSKKRRGVTAFFFVYAAIAILLAAEPFAEGLVETGKLFGIDEFFLVQWLAPLASEAPEFIVAALFALQGRAGLAVRTMISSKVNQWTLLIGMLPLAYAISAGSLDPMVMDARQNGEVMLTVAQSAFAVAILAKLDFSLSGAIALMVLFLVQFLNPELHGLFTYIYFGLGALILGLNRYRIRCLVGSAMLLFSNKE